MAQWQNVSGSTISVPIVENTNGQSENVQDQEIVTVPDDVVMAANYFVKL